MSPMEWIEENLQELAQCDPNVRTIQILSANPLVLTYDKQVSAKDRVHLFVGKGN